MVQTSTLTYLAVRQDVPDPWSVPAQCRSRSCFCHDPSCSPGYKAFSGAGSVAYQPVGDPHWAGFAPLATDLVAAAFSVSANTTDAEAFFLLEYLLGGHEPERLFDLSDVRG
jgi:hypothetical protein